MPAARVILHVDMDAFYASVEQRDEPSYRGQPLIVGAPPDRRGVVCAASYEARKFGVRSAMPSRTAGKLCPQGIFIRPRMEAYRTESILVMDLLRETTDAIEKVSVDEAYLDVSAQFTGLGADEALHAALPVARAIKERIAQERQLTASIGLAANKFLAKLGSDLQKPNGLTLIPEAGKAEFLAPLALGRIPGIGPVTERALAAAGLLTIGDLQQAKVALEPIVGSLTARLLRLAVGDDDRPLELGGERKSISSENTFPQDTDHRPTLRDALKELCADVAATLAKGGLGARTVQVKVRYSDFTTLTRQLRLEDPIFTEDEIYRLACHLLARHKLVVRPLRLLGVGVSHFSPPTPQLPLPL